MTATANLRYLHTPDKTLKSIPLTLAHIFQFRQPGQRIRATIALLKNVP